MRQHDYLTGKMLGLIHCHGCKLTLDETRHAKRCPRCHSRVHGRNQASLQRSWAFLLAAIAMYVPANIAPVMQTTFLGATTQDTILSGVAYFIREGDWLLAVVIFSASVLIPLLKMLALLYLLVTVTAQKKTRQREKTTLYRMTELVGRWSMVDVFVVGVLAAMVQMGNLTTIIPGLGIVSFAAVVILTMLAAQSFDPRLIWDEA